MRRYLSTFTRSFFWRLGAIAAVAAVGLLARFFACVRLFAS